jgi:2-polyprenyl-6-methoxyphenol hydroxylase-like FAD-dependent oxidoreductase
MTAERAPVAIVGGGPVGLVLSLELAHRGVPCVLFEQKATTTDRPKCMLTNMRSMEHFRRLGLARATRRAGIAADYRTDIVFATALFGHEICRFRYPSAEESRRTGAPTAFSSPLGAEPSQRISQIHQEAVLRRAAEAAAVDLRFGWRVDEVQQDGERVRVMAVEVASGQRRSIEADWVVAADGAGGAIREALGIPLKGRHAVSEQVGVFFRAPELRARNPLGDAAMWFVVHPELRGVLVAVDGKEHYVFHWTVPPGAAASMDARGVVARVIGGAVGFDVLAVHPWRPNVVVADAYRRGRVFLVGDAAHQLIPTGGFGMNTGIGEAVDLGWKLAAVVQGWGGTRLLDSYEVERRPIAVRNVAAASENARRLAGQPVPPALAADGPVADELRRGVGAAILATQRREFESAGVQLGYRYEDSPICASDGTPPPPDDPIEYVPTARPGSRAPHVRLSDDEVLYDRFGRDFTLLRLGGTRIDTSGLEAAARRRGVPLRVVELADAAVRDLYGRDLVLVRPDQHVAWRASTPPDDPLRLVDTARGAAPSGAPA